MIKGDGEILIDSASKEDDELIMEAYGDGAASMPHLFQEDNQNLLPDDEFNESGDMNINLGTVAS